MNTVFTESEVETAALGWFAELGYEVLFGPAIMPGEPRAERESFNSPILPRRLRNALQDLNPTIPEDAIEEAYRKILRLESPSLVRNNEAFHLMLVNGIEVPYRAKSGEIENGLIRLFDFDNVDANDFAVVNQFTLVEKDERRPDIIVFGNGLPLGVIELKNAADEKADIWKAFKDIQTYKAQIPSLFNYNEVCIISDGLTARIGSVTADHERFMPWRTVEGETTAATTEVQLDTLIHGVFEPKRFLDYLKYFIVFEHGDHSDPIKKIAGYHQFHAVNKAVATTIAASGPNGNHKCGVVWHTQGSGKSLTMAFYTGKIVLSREMDNPTIVVMTDRNDLDDQLFTTFGGCKGLLRQTPVQAESREDLRRLLKRASGGVFFTTMQKFMPDERGERHPLLSDRKNIVVVADEAHRSQYGFAPNVDVKTGVMSYGMAQNIRDALPNASFIGFTGTPIELTDANTRAVFGDYISIYDIQQAVLDKATVPIFYESRLAMLQLNPTEVPHLDEAFEEVTELEEDEHKERLKTKWAALEALVGAEKRVELIAEDIVRHYEARDEASEGKAMIVCMSRRICIELYNAIVKIRPHWHNEDDKKGAIKIVMTGTKSDPTEWIQHIRNKERRKKLSERFKKDADPFKIVLVRDMWLTGFDVPCLNTMYVDKPMRGHGLMQAIARVNRVYKEKTGGLVVDYLGIASSLKEALSTYTQAGGQGSTAQNVEQAVELMMAKHEVCTQFFVGLDWSAWKAGRPEQRLRLLPNALDHILKQEDGSRRFVQSASELAQAWALAVPQPEALDIKEDVTFFQAVRAALVKTDPRREYTGDLDHALRQLVSKAVATDGVLDIFQAAGLKKPDISILSDEFLEEVRGMPQKNLALELLKRLIAGDIKTHQKKNLIQSRKFSELLEKAVQQYQKRAIEAAEVIERLIELAREIREADKRGNELGLTEDELAFYDAIADNESAREFMADDILRKIAIELVEVVKRNTNIDWQMRESSKAQLRVYVKRILKKYGYPPDKQEKAAYTVVEQAEYLAEGWSLDR
jgi:type I restriction enzyme R subunit